VFNYANSAATALRLLTKFGRDVTHRKINEGTYNPETGTVTNTNTDTTVKAVDLDFSDKTNGNQYFTDNVQMGDRYALIAPSVASIDVSDKLIIGGVTWNVVNVKTLAPAGTVVLFTAQIRK
jgi:hypothetical protein